MSNPTNQPDEITDKIVAIMYKHSDEADDIPDNWINSSDYYTVAEKIKALFAQPAKPEETKYTVQDLWKVWEGAKHFFSGSSQPLNFAEFVKKEFKQENDWSPLDSVKPDEPANQPEKEMTEEWLLDQILVYADSDYSNENAINLLKRYAAQEVKAAVKKERQNVVHALVDIIEFDGNGDPPAQIASEYLSLIIGKEAENG